MNGKTHAAFGEFRAAHPVKPCNRAFVANDDQLIQMEPGDGLEVWADGPDTAAKGDTPLIDARPAATHLWVVRPHDVVHAAERGPFGQSLASKVIKHSNLTGGADAHCGGELLWLSDDSIALTGESGRYGPSSEAEMLAVAEAFRKSGYGVWSFGYSHETGTPYKFGDRDPEWIS